VNMVHELALLRKDFEFGLAGMRKDFESSIALLRKDMELTAERLERKVSDGDNRLDQKLSRRTAWILWSVLGAILLQLISIGTGIVLALAKGH
jgi:hypothetical protein